MKNPKFLLSLFIITLFLSVTSCSVEEEVLHREQSIKSNKITFDQFKKETGLKNIQTIKSIIPSFNNQDYNRRIENEFLVNTEVIERCVSQDNQTTYSFKIYPITVDLGEREYYNLVYEKIGTQWNEIIFLNKERANPQVGEAKLEESDMIYNKLGEKTVRNSTITITIHCNGSCAANGYASCDGFACPTGECLQVTVSYDYVPVGFTGVSSSGSVSVGGNPGGGSGFEGIYIPNPYDGDADLDNPDFVLAMNVAAFTRSLPQNLKNVIANNHYAHPLIVDFMRTNGGLTQANKDAVISALTAYAPIPYNANITFWSFATIEQFLVNSFNYLLKNPNQQGQAFVQSLLTPVEAIPDYLNQNTWSEESVDFVKELIEDMIDFPTSEGNDGNAPDFNYDDYSNVQTQLQSLPGRNSFYNAFPKNGTSGMEAMQVYQLIGGTIYNSHLNEPEKYRNACALRVSRALNYSGNPIPVFYNNAGQQRTQKGADNLNYILDAASMLAYMKKTFPNSNPIHLVNKSSTEFKTAINGKWGIYIMLPKNTTTFGASGHTDFWSNSGCLSGCHFDKAKEIYFWELF